MSKNHKKISLDITNNCHDVEDKNNISTTNTRNGLHTSISLSSKKETNKKDVARRRWGILARALKSPISSQPSSPTDEISMRRFSTFMLLTTQLLEDDNNIIYTNNEKKHLHKKQNWYRYSVQIGEGRYFVDVPHTMRSLTAADLMGFNNTGNVCVWPSEESLAYYMLRRLPDFQGKTVLELGGGMSALAGLMAAKYGACKLVHLTDGNHVAVENVRASLQRNQFGDTIVLCSVLQWGGAPTTTPQYDVVLSADCLFFDEARSDLIETMWASLSADGVAYVMAPKRGDTLDVFVACARMRGFCADTRLVYDEHVWHRHLECLDDNPDYDANIHYPILILLTKSS